MSTSSPALETLATTSDPAANAVREGLSATPKWLPAWLFYDAEGSRLFERITVLPEYYPTRTERAIFTGYADGIIEAALAVYDKAMCPASETVSTANETVYPVLVPKGTGGSNVSPAYTAPDGPTPRLRLLELGAGSASKTGVLLDAAVRRQGTTAYLPIDVSASAMEEACAAIQRALRGVEVHPQVANYVTDALDIPPHNGPTLALYIGSSIGNFDPAEAAAILQNLRGQLHPGDTLLLGTDLVKDRRRLEAAYNDHDGITEAFNLNILRRINRDLRANFDLANFRHLALWNAEQSRIEMHLQAVRACTVRIGTLNARFNFAAGETIHTENSYKFTEASIAALLQTAGYTQVKQWTDEQNWFAVTMSTPL